MKLKIINSNSFGNAYLLENDQEALLIECGVRFDKIKKALNFKLTKVVGCILSHEHNDHSKSVKEVLAAGINVWTSPGTADVLGIENSHRCFYLFVGKPQPIGGFQILPFDVKHDCAEPLGFLIKHEETGNILFLTDSYYSEYTFSNLNNVIIEANYCETILQNKLKEGETIGLIRDRVIQSHMSLATCKETLQANDLSQVNNIVLIHLSDSHSDAKRFQFEVEQQTGKQVFIAEANMVMDFNKEAF